MRKKLQVSFLILGFGLCSCAGPRSGSVNSTEPKLVFTAKNFKDQNLMELVREAGESHVGMMEFNQCNFTGITTFSALPNSYQSFPVGIFFKDCVFEGELNGGSVSFLGQVDFGKCQFKKGVSFRNSVFLAPAGFRDCGFDGEAAFQNSLFLKESTWVGSFFYTYSLFQGAKFFENAQFQNARFLANADFTQCRFLEGAIFDFCTASGKLDFSESRQDGLMTFRKSVLQKGMYMNHFRSFAPLRLLETQFGDSLYHQDFHSFAEKPEILNNQGKAAPSGF